MFTVYQNASYTTFKYLPTSEPTFHPRCPFITELFSLHSCTFSVTVIVTRMARASKPPAASLDFTPPFLSPHRMDRRRREGDMDHARFYHAAAAGEAARRQGLPDPCPQMAPKCAQNMVEKLWTRHALGAS